jgi:copper chaperone CopZ
MRPRENTMTQQNTVLNVASMSCGSCVRHVTSALAAVPGVSQVNVQLRSGIVEVQHRETAGPQELVEALAGAGYEASLRGQ